jgi:hypothetical protein
MRGFRGRGLIAFRARHGGRSATTRVRGGYNLDINPGNPATGSLIWKASTSSTIGRPPTEAALLWLDIAFMEDDREGPPVDQHGEALSAVGDTHNNSGIAFKSGRGALRPTA